MNAIGPIIAKYRKDLHLTQPELAELLKKEGIEVTDKCLYSWESNRTEPGIKQLFTLCKVLGIKDIYEEIFGVNPYNPLNKLNEEGRERANEYVDMLATNDKYLRSNAPVIEIPVIRTIHLYELGVSAGTGNYLDNEAYEVSATVTGDTKYNDSGSAAGTNITLSAAAICERATPTGRSFMSSQRSSAKGFVVRRESTRPLLQS